MAILNEAFEGDLVRIRSVTLDDAEFTLKIRQNKELTKYIPYLDITLEQQKAWIEKQIKTDGDYFFIVEYKDTGIPFATKGLVEYNKEKKYIEGVRNISLEKNPAYNFEADILLYKIAKKMGYIRWYAHIIDGNTKLIKMLELVNYKYDGREVNDRWSGNRYYIDIDDLKI